MKKLTPFLFFFLFSWAALAAQLKCPICGMEFKDSARSSFETTKEGAPIHLCSFACSRRFHAKFPKTPLFAHDFASGKKLPAENAYFLAKSKSIVKELDFDMPPSVVAFEEEKAAKAKQQQLKDDGVVVKGFGALEKDDGVVVKGFGALEKVYE